VNISYKDDVTAIFSPPLCFILSLRGCYCKILYKNVDFLQPLTTGDVWWQDGQIKEEEAIG
jgi:hypothetical protein